MWTRNSSNSGKNTLCCPDLRINILLSIISVFGLTLLIPQAKGTMATSGGLIHTLPLLGTRWKLQFAAVTMLQLSVTYFYYLLYISTKKINLISFLRVHICTLAEFKEQLLRKRCRYLSKDFRNTYSKTQVIVLTIFASKKYLYILKEWDAISVLSKKHCKRKVRRTIAISRQFH